MHCCAPTRNRIAAGLTAGFGLIALGVLYGLSNFHVVPLERFLRPGPIVLLLLAAIAFASRGFLAFGGHLLLLGAVALQLKGLGHSGWLAQGWPAGLIWLGVVMVFRAFLRRRPSHREQGAGERSS